MGDGRRENVEIGKGKFLITLSPSVWGKKREERREMRDD